MLMFLSVVGVIVDSVASAFPVYETSPRPVTLRPLASLPCYTPWIVIDKDTEKPVEPGNALGTLEEVFPI